MIRLNLSKAPVEFMKGIVQLGENYSFQHADDGLPVIVVRRPGNIEIKYDTVGAMIFFDHHIHFYRALGLLVEWIVRQPERGHMEEIPQFDFNGMMFDVSRNAVLTVKSIHQILDHMAIMGLNGFMLYTEDVYTVPDEPYFGYMRGKYSDEELREIDDYAHMYGIEVIPCIQTLAHVSHVLKWDFEQAYSDTSDIFLVGAEQTYALIEKMIVAISLPLRSRRIHIGMDEAFFLGTGTYLQRHGYRNRFDMMNEHLKKVLAIVERMNLEPMIWSDMYFRMGSVTKDYYDRDAKIPREIIDGFDPNTQLVYWDYYHHHEDEYMYYIQKHQEFGAKIIFAGGVWTWNGITPHYQQMTMATHAGLHACKKTGIRDVFATIWADNGAETNLFTALPGMQLYAEHGYHQVVDDIRIKERFHFCTGAVYDDFMMLNQLNELSENDRKHVDGYFPSNPSKFLLWQDLLLGLFDKHVEGLALESHYHALETKIRHVANQPTPWTVLFHFYAQLSQVLSLKSEMGLRLTAWYKAGNHSELQEAVHTYLPELEKQIQVLRKIHRTLWFQSYKANGWEVIDIRYGGLLARVDSTCYRLQMYLSGEVTQLEELEEDRLYFDGGQDRLHRSSGFCNYYHDIVSVGNLSEFTKM
jgi:hexosaminidase